MSPVGTGNGGIGISTGGGCVLGFVLFIVIILSLLLETTLTTKKGIAALLGL